MRKLLTMNDRMNVRTILVLVGILLASVSHGESGLVNTPGDGFLALRSEPSVNTGVRLSKIPHATAIDLSECVSRSRTERWCKTSYQGKDGWVLEKYVTRGSGGAIRARPATASEKKAILKAIENDCTPNWCKPIINDVLGDYASVGFACKKENCEGSLAFLKKSGTGWILVDQGTGIQPEDLIGYGFPPDVAHALAY